MSVLGGNPGANILYVTAGGEAAAPECFEPCCDTPCEFENGLPKPQCCCDPEDPNYCGPLGPCLEPPFDDDPPEPCPSDSCPSLDISVVRSPTMHITAQTSGTWLHPAGTGTSTGSCDNTVVAAASIVGGNYNGAGNWTCTNAWTFNVGGVGDIYVSISANMGCNDTLPFSSVNVSFATEGLFNLGITISRTGATASVTGADLAGGGFGYPVLDSISGFITPFLYCGRVYGFSFSGSVTLRPSNPASTGRKTLTVSGVAFMRDAHPPVCCNTTSLALTTNERVGPSPSGCSGCPGERNVTE